MSRRTEPTPYLEFPKPLQAAKEMGPVSWLFPPALGKITYESVGNLTLWKKEKLLSSQEEMN